MKACFHRPDHLITFLPGRIGSDGDPARPVIFKNLLTLPDPTRPDPTRPDPTRPDPIRTDAIRPDPTRPDPTRPDPTRPDPTRPDPTHEIFRAPPRPSRLDPLVVDNFLIRPAGRTVTREQIWGKGIWEPYRTYKSSGYGYASVTALTEDPGIVAQAYITHRSPGYCGTSHNSQKFRVGMKMLYPYPGYCGMGVQECL